MFFKPSIRTRKHENNFIIRLVFITQKVKLRRFQRYFITQFLNFRRQYKKQFNSIAMDTKKTIKILVILSLSVNVITSFVVLTPSATQFFVPDTCRRNAPKIQLNLRKIRITYQSFQCRHNTAFSWKRNAVHVRRRTTSVNLTC